MAPEAISAVVRAVPNSFAHATVMHPAGVLDPAQARRQHAVYQAALSAAGYDVVVVPADELHPDCVFVEDTAVLIGQTALMGRSGAPQRRGEVEAVVDVLSARYEIMRVEAPATLDGGDVFRLHNTVYVGRSTRTNDAGIAMLAGLCEHVGLETRVVEVHDALHLKSAVLPLDADTVLVTRGGVDLAALEGLRVVYEAAEERYRCSVLPLRGGKLLVTGGAPKTSELLVSLGYDVEGIDVSQFVAADGGLTCMSILL